VAAHNPVMTQPSDRDYAALLAFRTELRRFQRWSDQQAQAAGLTHAQHQLLLAVRGHLDPRGPTVGEVAEYLLLKPAATVELLDRVERGGFVRRRQDGADRRVVRLQLTPLGERCLATITTIVVPMVRELAPLLQRLTEDFTVTDGRPPEDGASPAAPHVPSGSA
jgi:DNA-binding MarR family transcriptional regulator